MAAKHTNLATALAAFQAEMPAVAKTKRANVGQYAYTYADLADVTEAAGPVLAKHGLAFAGSARHVESGRYEVVGILSHESGEQREGALPLSAGGTPQQMGSAITYSRRYLFGLMTGVVTDNDDDGSLASRQAKRKAAAAPADDAQPWSDEPPDLHHPGDPMSAKTRGHLFALFGQKGIPEDQQLAGANHLNGTAHTSRSQITEQEAKALIAVLKQRPDVDASDDTPVAP